VNGEILRTLILQKMYEMLGEEGPLDWSIYGNVECMLCESSQIDHASIRHADDCVWLTVVEMCKD